MILAGGLRALPIFLVVLTAFCLTRQPAFAHGGVSIEKDVCKLQLGPFFMHFTGYQPDATGSKEFCKDIPQTGRTTLVLDAVDPELHEMPIEVRIIRDTGDKTDLDAVTVLHIPAKRYPTGSIAFDYRFDEPGRFVGFVVAGERGQYKARFPFSVAQNRHDKYFLILGVFGLGFALYAYSGRARRRTKGRSTEMASLA